MKKHIAILAVMLMAIHITQAQWTELSLATNHTLGANFPILSIATDVSGNVYAAGEFMDSSTHHYVARWSGDTAWAPLGKGIHGLNANGYIYSITTDSVGAVYAAGAFTDAQLQGAGNVYVAKWSADTGWIELGANGVVHVPGTNGTAILSIAVDPKGNVYAAGQFVDAHSKYYVAKWDGTSWTELGTGANALNANGYIQRLTADPQGNIYAAGSFTDPSGMRYVAMWDGSSWSEMGVGANALNAAGPIAALTSDAFGDIYVSYNDTSFQFYVASWNGTNWAQVGTGANALNANNAINSLTTDISGNLYAAGNFTDDNGSQYVAMWNGTTWSELGTGHNSLDPNGYILTIATDTVYNVYAAGNFFDGTNDFFVSKYNPNTQRPSGIHDISLPGVDQATIMPNPSYAHAAIALSVTQATTISISIYDMTGREVSDIYEATVGVGEMKVPFDAGRLSSGVYLIKISDDTSSIQKRFVKL